MHSPNMYEADNYMIFSSHLSQINVEAYLKNHWIGYKVVRGKYENVRETAYIVNLANDMIVFQPLLSMQKTVLMLSSMTSKGRHAILCYLASHIEEDLGYFQEATPEEADASNSYTYDPSNGVYYVARTV